VIAGDPSTETPWLALDAVIAGTYRDAWGKPWQVDVWGVDSGYLSQTVYRYVHRHAHTGRVRALDGRPGWRRPAIGSPQTKDVDWEGRKVGGVQLWPVGTWDLKSELYGRLRLTIKGPNEAGEWPPGCMWFNGSCDREYFEQLTAEFLTDIERRNGHVDKAWQKIKGRRNEQHDLAVYSLALARHATEGWQEPEWLALAQQRLGAPAEAQLDLAAFWAPGVRDQVPAAVAEPAAPAPDAAPPAVVADDWINAGDDWLARGRR
jgi:phage terminase large subunit GpA-like protein